MQRPAPPAGALLFGAPRPQAPRRPCSPRASRSGSGADPRARLAECIAAATPGCARGGPAAAGPARARGS